MHKRGMEQQGCKSGHKKCFHFQRFSKENMYVSFLLVSSARIWDDL